MPECVHGRNREIKQKIQKASLIDTNGSLLLYTKPMPVLSIRGVMLIVKKHNDNVSMQVMWHVHHLSCIVPSFVNMETLFVLLGVYVRIHKVTIQVNITWRW